MIWFKRLFTGLLVLVLLAAAALAVYAYRAFPVLDGELQAAGLQGPVALERDKADVTHIKAQSPHDAWFALGYVHAQERGWQLEFNRRVMHGELSEAFGPATLETDKLLRTLGVVRAAERQWQNLPAEGRDAMQAYSDGINAFYANSSQALSPEFHILGVKPGGPSGKAWSPTDSLAWSLMMALDLGGNWGTEFARLYAARTLKTAELWQLFPPYPGEQPASDVDFSKLYADLGVYRAGTPAATQKVSAYDRIHIPEASSAETPLVAGVNDWAATLGQADGKGSNNWVVAGSHSRTGKPLLANDPHLGLSAPAIWYFARLQAEGLDVVGATLPGLPFVVLGRTQKVAWSFTNTAPDVQDLYLEQVNPANPRQYRLPRVPGSTPTAEAWADFQTREETIKVKGQPDVVLTVRESRHGPVLSDVQKSHADLLDTSKYVIALRWAALDADNQTVLAGLRANRAQSADEMIAAFAAYHSPMQNLVTADVAGRMAFKAAGKVPLRKPDNDIRGIAPSPGWDARYDWAGWVPYAQTPQTGQGEIEAKGWLSTANQRITPPNFPIFMGQDWTVPYRYNRIEQLLAATPQHDMASMQKIQADQLSAATAKLLPFLQKTLSQPGGHALADAARQATAGFDGTMRADQAAPLIFAAWADELTRGIIGAKLGEPALATLYGKRHFRSTLEDVLERNDANWCGAAGCAAQSTAALGRALNRLQAAYGADVSSWTWGRAHPALSAHKPFGNVPLLARFFDVRVPTGGDTFTVNVGQYWATSDATPFANRQAASLRAVYDMADLENSRFIYQTGQSGLVFSSRYRDMRDDWAAVRYRPLQMNPPAWAHQLTLRP
ncbi:penicillin amidase [Polaromonas sp. YR568]|uniref:penicillin acylase family protein n=1 Tax=Polaromonas sp. YR568 TaxID=1855301 RepID=UPI0008EB736E|nr:penicillin acylase family protein [Polaromonas sp. YR568]SFU47222.1 penicillin amidase [Polaromonas sp. YR568]